MRALSSYTKTIIKQVRESLRGLSIPSSSAGSGRQSQALYNPIPSPYVTSSSGTHMSFIFGLSEYGGEDVVMPPTTPYRSQRRYFLEIRGDNQDVI